MRIYGRYTPPALVETIATVDIGAWNMDNVMQLDVPHGLSFANIRDAMTWVWDDSGTLLFPINYTTGAMTDVEGSQRVSATIVRLTRRTGGYFDSVDFDDGVMNRGFIMMWYVQ